METERGLNGFLQWSQFVIAASGISNSSHTSLWSAYAHTLSAYCFIQNSGKKVFHHKYLASMPSMERTRGRTVSWANAAVFVLYEKLSNYFPFLVVLPLINMFLRCIFLTSIDFNCLGREVVGFKIRSVITRATFYVLIITWKYENRTWHYTLKRGSKE